MNNSLGEMYAGERMLSERSGDGGECVLGVNCQVSTGGSRQVNAKRKKTRGGGGGGGVRPGSAGALLQFLGFYGGSRGALTGEERSGNR